MSSRKLAAPFQAALAIPVHFQVGKHALSISRVAEGRWTVSVDGGPPSRTYQTQVEAWEAGVRTSDEQDQLGRT